jgi:hypothetical protein
MIVDVLDEEDTDCPFFLGQEGFAERARCLRPDNPVKRALRVELARLMIEYEDDISLDR